MRLCLYPSKTSPLFFLEQSESRSKPTIPGVDRFAIDPRDLSRLGDGKISRKTPQNFIDLVFAQSPIFYGHDLHSSRGDAGLGPNFLLRSRDKEQNRS